MSERASMSRAVRTARGAFGALAVTLIAATSHGLADGVITFSAVLATAILALPLCVLLAGRVGSLWRLTLAVVPAQFAYHWLFAGLGTVSLQGSADAGLAVSPHAAHLGMLSSPLPADIVAAGAADAMMWLMHALAAAFTIALLHRGERAALQLARVLHRLLPARLPLAVQLPELLFVQTPVAPGVRSAQQIYLSAISRRGPPVCFSL